MTNRTVLHADESFMAGKMFVLVAITENEPGYTPLESYWGDLAKAQAYAKETNERMGFSEQDVLDVRASSMAVSRTFDHSKPSEG